MAGVVETTHTFANNEVITSTLMNNIIDETLFTSDALVSGNGTLALVAGKLKVATAGITSNEMGTTTAKIADAAVTAPKLNGAQTGSAPVFGVRAWAKLNPYVSSIRTGAYKSGNYTRTATETTVTMTDHGLKANDKIRLDFTSGTATDGLYTVTSSANANEFVVNHTGSSTSGNVTAQFVAIQASGNISTASWFDTGDDTIVLNFATQMPNDDYASIVTGQFFPGAWATTTNEYTVGNTQANTVYQAHIYMNQPNRFINVVIIG